MSSPVSQRNSLFKTILLLKLLYWPQNSASWENGSKVCLPKTWTNELTEKWPFQDIMPLKLSYWLEAMSPGRTAWSLVSLRPGNVSPKEWESSLPPRLEQMTQVFPTITEKQPFQDHIPLKVLYHLEALSPEGVAQRSVSPRPEQISWVFPIVCRQNRTDLQTDWLTDRERYIDRWYIHSDIYRWYIHTDIYVYVYIYYIFIYLFIYIYNAHSAELKGYSLSSWDIEIQHIATHHLCGEIFVLWVVALQTEMTFAQIMMRWSTKYPLYILDLETLWILICCEDFMQSTYLGSH